LNPAVSLQLNDSIAADLQAAGRLVTAYGGEQKGSSARVDLFSLTNRRRPEWISVLAWGDRT
jgi:hypothetical protein